MLYTIVDKLNQTISFDCVLNADESYSSTVVEHAVETGSPITDHVYLQNPKFSLTGVVSDFNFFNPVKGVYGATAFFDSQGVLVANTSPQPMQENIKEALKQLHLKREFCSLIVGSKPDEKLHTHSNLIINSLSFPDSPENGDALFVTISFVQIRTTSIETKAVKKVPEALVIISAEKKSDGSKAPITKEGAAGAATIPEPTTTQRIKAGLLAETDDIRAEAEQVQKEIALERKKLEGQ
jgi:hypothetical protein